MPEGGFDVHAAYAAHAGELLAFASASLRDRAAAEDCVQEAFVRAWRARERHDSAKGSVRTWLFAITRNVVLDAVRARTRRPVVADDPAQDRADPRDDVGSVVERMRLAQALATLSAEHRAIVVAVHVNGRDYAEVSLETGVPAATLRTRMYHGLRALRRALEEVDRDTGS